MFEKGVGGHEAVLPGGHRPKGIGHAGRQQGEHPQHARPQPHQSARQHQQRPDQFDRNRERGPDHRRVQPEMGLFGGGGGRSVNLTTPPSR
jgi:hypothetical protein